MTIPDAPQPATPANTQTDVTAQPPRSALAVTALVVGAVAFVSGLAPFWGLLVGSVAIVLGAIAVSKKQSKGFALSGIVLGAIAAFTSLLTTIVLVAGIATMGNTSSVSKPPVTATSVPSESLAETSAPTPEPTASAEEVEEVEAEPTATVSQLNALGSAVSYLNFSAFSRSGLIKQLEYEGYSKADAKYAVDTVGANWKEQAAKSAENYLSFTTFSRSGLIDQLIFEGFTTAEAKFGVDSVGL